MNRADAFAFLGVALAAALTIGYFAYSIGPVLTGPHVKSDRELCEERGGVYVTLRSGPNRCFAKEAFK